MIFCEKKNKEVRLLESTDDFTMAKKMANFLMNKIYKINDALESYDKFKPVERNMDSTWESFRELGIEEIKN